MKLLAFLFILFSTAISQAQVLAGVGGGLVVEQGNDGQDYQTQTQLLVRGGYQIKLIDAYLEYSNFSSDDGVQIMTTTRTHQEWTLWGRYVIDRKWIVSPTLALGTGFQYDSVKTEFNGQTTNDTGAPSLLIASSAGVRIALHPNVELALEGRMSFSSGYVPNPLFGVAGLVGLKF